MMKTDGTGTQTYAYDELSRMTSETKDFTELTNNLTISYSYHLGGGLKSITDPFNATVNYANDKTGRVTAVTGMPYGQNATGNYASNIKYRAFGQIKQMDYNLPDHTPQIKLEYDSRLRVSHSEVTSTIAAGGFAMKADFSYFADSRAQAKDDLLDNKWDRTMKYDHAGRLTFNQFGMGLSSDETMKRVYQQTVQYDGFSMMTSRSGVHWDNDIGYTESYVNGRIQNQPNLIYDAAGNIVRTDGGADPHTFQKTTFDAAGRRVGFHGSSKGRWGGILNMVTERKSGYQFDGDGRPVIEKEGSRYYHISDPPPPPNWAPDARQFQVWSTVLGSSLTTVAPDGGKRETKVFAGGAIIAVQGLGGVAWRTADPVTGTTGGFGYYNGASTFYTEETEPFGQTLRPNDPTPPTVPDPPGGGTGVGSADDPQWQCQIPKEFYGGFSGLPFHCQMKVLMDLDRSLADIYGFSQREDNPLKLAELTDAPILDFDLSPSDEMLTFALTSTSKQQDRDKKKRGKPKLKVRDKNAPRPVVNEADFEKPIRPPEPFDPNTVSPSEFIEKLLAFTAIISDRVIFIGFKDDQVSDIKVRLYMAVLIKPCVDAYKAFPGIKATPAEVIRDRGITYVNHNVLGFALIEPYLGINNPSEARMGLLARTSQATTISPLKNSGDYEKYPNQRIITRIDLNHSDSNLDEDIFHELVHGGGVPGQFAISGGLSRTHDLSNYGPKYEKIIEACNPAK